MYTINSFSSSQPSNRFCTDNIGVYVWESDVKVTNLLIPNPLTSNSSYREVATIRRQGSDQTISLALQLTKRYIVLGFLDQGGCKILSSVRITYNICPGTTLSNSLVDLRETVAPFSVVESILVEGTCTADSFHFKGSLNVTCESSGQWNISQKKTWKMLEGHVQVCLEINTIIIILFKVGFTYYHWSEQMLVNDIFITNMSKFKILYYG